MMEERGEGDGLHGKEEEKVSQVGKKRLPNFFMLSLIAGPFLK